MQPYRKFPHEYSNGYYWFNLASNAKALAKFYQEEARRNYRERTAERDGAESE